MWINKTNVHVKGFALGLALKQSRKGTWEIARYIVLGRREVPTFMDAVPLQVGVPLHQRCISATECDHQPWKEKDIWSPHILPTDLV